MGDDEDATMDNVKRMVEMASLLSGTKPLEKHVHCR